MTFTGPQNQSCAFLLKSILSEVFFLLNKTDHGRRTYIMETEKCFKLGFIYIYIVSWFTRIVLDSQIRAVRVEWDVLPGR